MNRRLLVVDLRDPNHVPGAANFLDSLRNSGIAIVPSTDFSGESTIRAAIGEGNEIVGFAGDSDCNITIASQVAKAGGVIFAYGDGPLSSWCKSSAADSPEPSAWLHLNNFGEAMRLHAFQQRIGGN